MVLSASLISYQIIAIVKCELQVVQSSRKLKILSPVPRIRIRNALLILAPLVVGSILSNLRESSRELGNEKTSNVLAATHLLHAQYSCWECASSLEASSFKNRASVLVSSVSLHRSSDVLASILLSTCALFCSQSSAYALPQDVYFF